MRNTIEKEIKKIEVFYKEHVYYYYGEIFGETYKLRLNKDHGWRLHNGHNNIGDHMLSLVNVDDHTLHRMGTWGLGCWTDDKLCWQIPNIRTWEEVRRELENFFFCIHEDYAGEQFK